MPQDAFVDNLSEYFRTGKAAVEFLKAGAALIPKGDKRAKAEARIADAESALRMSEASAAQSLGYKLCQCTLPPQVMLSKGHHTKYNEKEIFECPLCEKQEPPPGYFERHDKVREHNQRQGNSWVDARRRRR